MRAAWLDRPWVTALFGVLAAILTWDPPPIEPAPGLDASWMLGLNWGAQLGLDHGSQIVFTYGPLGFLQEPLVIDGLQATVGAVYLLGLRAALAASLLYAARRSLPWLPAALLALVATMITPRPIVPLSLAAVWAVGALQDGVSPRARRLLLLGGGSLAGLEVLVKLNVGISILVLVVIAAVALPGARLRNLATMLGAFALTATVLWLLAGQGPSNVDDYVRSSLQIVSGYSDTMQLENPVVPWDWWAALVAAAATLAATVVATAGREWRQRIPLALVGAVVVFSLFKYGFVRHDDGHVGDFFGGLAALWLAVRWRGAARLAPAVALIALTIVCIDTANDLDGGPLRPRQAIDQLTTLLIPGERADARDEARAGMQQIYAIDPATIERIGDAPVDVRPWEIGVAWAYDLDWRPLPVIQDYQAYTPALDELNADALAADDGPQFLLRHLGYENSPVVSIDGRFTSFDVPQQTLVTMCLFRPVQTTEAYQLLERGPNRCGEPRPLGSATASYGEQVDVPRARPNEAVFAKIEGAAPSGIERLRSFAFRGALRKIDMNSIGRARLAPHNAESGLLLEAPPAADYAPPWSLAPQARSFSIDSDDGPLSSESTLEIEFEAIPIVPLD